MMFNIYSDGLEIDGGFASLWQAISAAAIHKSAAPHATIDIRKVTLCGSETTVTTVPA